MYTGQGTYPTTEELRRLTKFELIDWLLQPEDSIQIKDLRAFAGEWPDLYESRDYHIYFIWQGGGEAPVDKQEVMEGVENPFLLLYNFYQELRKPKSEEILIYGLKVEKEEMVMDTALVWRNQDIFYQKSVEAGSPFERLNRKANRNPSNALDYQTVWHVADVRKAELYQVYLNGIPDSYELGKLWEEHRCLMVR